MGLVCPIGRRWPPAGTTPPLALAHDVPVTQHETDPSLRPDGPLATSSAARAPRRTWLPPTLAIALVALGGAAFMVPVNAVIESPGPTWNVLGGVTAEGASVPLPSDLATPDQEASPSASSSSDSSSTTPQPATASPSPSGVAGSAAPSTTSPAEDERTATDQGEAAASGTDSDQGIRPLISVTGAQTYPAAGALRMTTVSVRGCPGYPVTAWDVLRAWMSRDEVVVDRESVCPRSMTAEEVEEVNQAQMSGSEDSAVTAALMEAGVATRQTLTVTGVARQQSAPVRPGDVIQALVQDAGNGERTQVETYAGLREVLATIPAGTQVTLEVLREGEEVAVPLTTLAPDGGEEGEAASEEGSQDASEQGSGSSEQAGQEDAGESGSLLGVLLDVSADSPVKATFALQDVGGPSAGMMFALGIVDTLTPGDLTGGKDVAGTGTISPDGTVGPIGGIAQKMAGAAHDGARYFLAPADNCAEVVGHEPEGLEVYSVSTLHEAVQATEAIAQGTTDGLPVCRR